MLARLKQLHKVLHKRGNLLVPSMKSVSEPFFVVTPHPLPLYLAVSLSSIYGRDANRKSHYPNWPCGLARQTSVHCGRSNIH